MARRREVLIVESSVLPKVAAERIAELIRRAAAERSGPISVALAGGTTPRAVHEALVDQDVPWSQVSIYFGDERCVPPASADSNYRMAMESLLAEVPVPEENVHRMPAELADRQAAARAYEAQLPSAFDVLMLGMGEDGHTASLFPGSPAVTERERRVLPVVGPKPPPERLTITPRVIAAAANVVMLVSGAAKAAPLVRALEGDHDPSATPAQLARDGLWIIDRAAASGLKAN